MLNQAEAANRSDVDRVNQSVAFDNTLKDTRERNIGRNRTRHYVD